MASDRSPGFDRDHVLTFRMSAAWSERPEAVIGRQQRTLQRLHEIPGVASAALSSILPAGASYPPSEFTIVGRETGDRYFAVFRQVSADYFSTLRIPMLQGAACRDDPRLDAPGTVLVSRAFADRFFPGESAIGRYVASSDRPLQIVGTVGSVRERGLMNAAEPTVYRCGLLPYYPDPYYLVRTDPQRAVTMVAVREALREIEPRRAVYAAATLSDTLSESMSQPRLNTVLLALFAAMALLLVAVGLYGMLAQFVSERQREIGLRMALGARPSQVLSQIVRYGASVTSVGLAIGLAGALLLSRFIAALVFDVSPRDPWTYLVVPIVLSAIAAAATLVPARRAVRLDPMKALRDER